MRKLFVAFTALAIVALGGMAVAAVINGTPGPDNLNGTSGIDQVKGKGAEDVIRGRSGNDNLIGGHGDDTIQGGNGHDLVSGGGGDDTLTGGAANALPGSNYVGDFFVCGDGVDEVTDFTPYGPSPDSTDGNCEIGVQEVAA